MTIPEIQQKIITDDAFILSELEKICTYYQLKHTPRWAHIRTQDEVESVAEHIYGMNILIEYFLPLLDISLDGRLVRSIALWHDMAEALVGDMTSHDKTDNHKKAEKDAEQELVETAPEHLKETLRMTYDVFDEKATPEAEFVKAIDKIEPLFHLYFLSKCYPDTLATFDLGWSSETYVAYRARHLDAFPLIKRFDTVLTNYTKQFHPQA